eukprot:scaffold5532_cov263-Pinguiococcus_pyrenoidosus.AAC.4
MMRIPVDLRHRQGRHARTAAAPAVAEDERQLQTPAAEAHRPGEALSTRCRSPWLPVRRPERERTRPTASRDSLRRSFAARWRSSADQLIVRSAGALSFRLDSDPSFASSRRSSYRMHDRSGCIAMQKSEKRCGRWQQRMRQLQVSRRVPRSL